MTTMLSQQPTPSPGGLHGVPWQDLAASLGELATPEELVVWSVEAFGDRRMVLTTGFGMEGCALVDMYGRLGRPMEVVYLDTGFLFPETHRLRERMEARYPHLSFVNRGTDLTPEKQAERYGDALWERDPDLCCRLRKVEPMRAALAGADVWITGLFRRQSSTRSSVRVLDYDPRYEVVKLSPLAAWDRRRVWEYVQRRGVPYNPLHHQGYPSIGCTHCTRRVAGTPITEYTRKGRWAGREKTECGLHDAVGKPIVPPAPGEGRGPAHTRSRPVDGVQPTVGARK